MILCWGVGRISLSPQFPLLTDLTNQVFVFGIMPWFYCPYSVADPPSIQQPALQSLSDDVWSWSQTAQDPTTSSKEQDQRPP